MGKAGLKEMGAPAVCGEFAEAFEVTADEATCPVSGWRRDSELTWNGERLFAQWYWSDGETGPAVALGIQLFPKEGRVFIGAIEVREDLRGQGIGSAVIGVLERAAKGVGHRNGAWRFRLFARDEVAEFWRRLGYRHEADVRYLWK